MTLRCSSSHTGAPLYSSVISCESSWRKGISVLTRLGPRRQISQHIHAPRKLSTFGGYPNMLTLRPSGAVAKLRGSVRVRFGNAPSTRRTLTSSLLLKDQD